jgi:phytoene dehydrogenase-like protein
LAPAASAPPSRWSTGTSRGATPGRCWRGWAAHSIVPLEWAGTAAYGLILGISAHADGWPIARGGSQRVADAMASYLRSLGGVVETGAPVTSLRELPPSDAVLCDVTPRQLSTWPATCCRRGTSGD